MLRSWHVVGFVLLMLASTGGGQAAFAGVEEEDEPRPVRYTASSLRASLLYHNASGMGGRPGVFGASRSTPLAFGLSALVPGLGQAYNRQWVKAAVALGIEVALVVGYSTWRSRGIDGRDAYQAYAHTYWSPVRYADWLNEYTTWLEAEHNASIDASAVLITEMVRGIDFSSPDTWGADEKVAVRRLIDQIQDVEENVFHPETGAAFSHKLPFFGEQQYYELIGKYFQFAPGWSDYQFFIDEEGHATWMDEDGNFIRAIDPETTGPNGTKPHVSARFYDYAEDHGTANDYLRRASRVSVFFVANHFLAAVDAAVFSKLHNDRLEARLTVSHSAFGKPEPGALLRFTF